jgi:hypothetical protein
MTADDRRVFEGLAVPAPPRDLKAATVKRSRHALALARPDLDPWNRLWNHLSLRLAWTVAAVALLVANIVTGLDGRCRGGQERSKVAATARQLETELRFIVELPAIDALAFGHGGAASRSENAS